MALNRGCHLYSAGRPSRWALAHISSFKGYNGVCVSVYRTDDRASLQRLVFNMHDSDVVKFDNHICHNATLDQRTRRALYSKIRRQVARNFEQANKSHKDPICRYCEVTAGAFSDYVAFVVFSETVEFNTSASQDESVPSATAAAADKSTGAEGDANRGKSKSKFREAGKEVSKRAVDDRSEVKEHSWKVLGEIVQHRSVKRKEVKPVGRKVSERKGKNVIMSEPEATETSRAGQQLAGKQVDDNVKEERNHENLTHEVIGETETGAEKATAMLVDHMPDVEPVDEIDNSCQPDELDRMTNEEQLDITSKQDVPELSTDTAATKKVSSPLHRHEVIVEISSRLNGSSEMDASSELYVWKNETELPANLDVGTDDKNTEFKKLSDWLFSRISLTTALHRFPTQYDLPVLGPQENPEWSVTWRLAEKFSPFGPSTETELGTRKKTHDEHIPDVPLAGEQSLKGGKAASHVVFIGPYDASVVRHSEVVRRRVGLILDDLLPQSSADVFCITDVGHDVSLTRVGDIVDTSRLPAADFGAYTASNAGSAPVSCVLLRFSPSAD